MTIGAEKYINPFTDFGFKKLFGTEVNKDLLMDFLNELICIQGKIKEVKYLNSEQLGRSEEDRRAVFDIYCETDTGETFIVEVKLMDTQKKTVFYDKLTFIYLEMPKFNKSIEELETRFEKWMYVLKNLPKLQELPPQFQERIFEKIFRVAEIAKMNKQEIAEYEENLKKYRDLNSAIETAKREGEIEGEIKGEIKGEKKGRIEEKNEIALKMLEDGISIECICRYTDLSEVQIKELNKELK